MSILGVASPPASSNPTPAVPPLHTVPPITQQTAFPAQGPAPTSQRLPFFQPPVPYPQAPSAHDGPSGSTPTQPTPIPHNPVTANRVGNASFAQAAGGTSPVPPTPFPNLLANLEAEFGSPSNGPAPSINGIVSGGPGQTGVNGAGQSSQIPFDAPTGPRAAPPPAPPGAPHHPRRQGHPMVESLVSAAETQLREGRIRKIGENEMNEVGKRMFVQDILQLIHVRTGLGMRRYLLIPD